MSQPNRVGHCISPRRLAGHEQLPVRLEPCREYQTLFDIGCRFTVCPCMHGLLFSSYRYIGDNNDIIIVINREDGDLYEMGGSTKSLSR